MICSSEMATVLTLLAAVGGLVVARSGPAASRASWPPKITLPLAAALTWLILIVSPNRAVYNLQAFAVPAVVLATVLLVRLAEWDSWPYWPRVATAGTALALVAAAPIARGVDLNVPGYTVTIADLRTMVGLGRSNGATCVGFAPRHPIFCRDATDLYMVWDIVTPAVPSISAAAKRPYLEMWSKSIAAIESRPPTLIVDPWVWHDVRRAGYITNRQYDRFQEFTAARYRFVPVGKFLVLVRKAPDEAGPGGK
jgi:hypothetical protein